MRKLREAGNSTKGDIFFFLTACLVVALDQISKFLIRAYLVPGQSVPPNAPIRLTYVANTGGAFGMFGDQTFLLTIAGIVGVVAIILYYRYPLVGGTLLRSGLGLQLGGAVGNLIDRLQRGYVTDFLDVRFWPVFNLADSAIVIGVSILTYSLLFSRRS